MMRPTMADVAEKAGVSTSTVSLVLNDKPGISPEVRIAVMQAVDSLGYRVRDRRLSLKPVTTASETRRISVIHFASPEPDYHFEASGLFVDFVAGIQDYLQDENINWVLIPDYQDKDQNNFGYRLLQSGNFLPDGLILIGILNQNSPLLQKAIADQIPIVVASRNWPDLPVSTVSQDHRQQVRLALEHLIGLGHKKIAFLAREVDRNYDWFQIRLDCYREILTAIGETKCDDLVAIGANGAEAIKNLLSRRSDVTAVFAIHDENAVSAMKGLRELGLEIPRDISLIGLDDSVRPLEGYPTLTTVSFPHNKAGQLAAQLLLEQLENDGMFYSKVFLRCHLIERESCAPPRSRS